MPGCELNQRGFVGPLVLGCIPLECKASLLPAKKGIFRINTPVLLHIRKQLFGFLNILEVITTAWSD